MATWNKSSTAYKNAKKGDGKKAFPTFFYLMQKKIKKKNQRQKLQK